MMIDDQTRSAKFGRKIGRNSVVILLLSALFMISMPLPKAASALPSAVTLSRSIFAVVNGFNFTGTGSGTACPSNGVVEGIVVFSAFPPSYHPFLMRCSWHCVHHPPFAEEYIGGLNFYTLAQGEYDAHTVITYPNGWGTLDYMAQARMSTPTLQVASINITGNYTGPTDIIEESIPFKDAMHPSGPGKVIAESNRSVVRSDHSVISIAWHTEYTFLNGTVSMPFDQTMSYEPIESSWTPANNTLHQKTHVAVTPANIVGGVGRTLIPLEKLGLLAPHIGVASMIAVAAAIATICVKSIKKAKEAL